jgi:hypothetical protein
MGGTTYALAFEIFCIRTPAKIVSITVPVSSSSSPLMSSLPQIACRSDKAILNFGNVADTFPRYPKNTLYRPLSPKTLPNPSLRSLKIYLGSELSDTCHTALVASLQHIRNNCSNLQFVLVVAHTKSWVETAALVRRWESPSLVFYKERIIDPNGNVRASTSCHKRGLQWDRLSSISFPVEDLTELSELIRRVPQLRTLTLLPTTDPSRALDDCVSLAQCLVQLLPNLRDLHKISLPSELGPFFGSLLEQISSLPHCDTVNLAAVPTIPVNQVTAGFAGFDHLRKLSLTAHILSADLCLCLGALQSLRSLAITATRSVPLLPYAMQDGFCTLRTLKVLGSQGIASDLVNAFRAFVPLQSPVRRVVVDVARLSYRGEMQDTLGFILRHREEIKGLDIRIKGTHGSESRDWMDLSLLGSLLSIRKFSITHPRPLPLTDSGIGRFIRAWPLATFLSFNPRPTLPPWPHLYADTVTLNCLTEALKGENLRHLGVYLNPCPAYNGNSQAHTNLLELDLGDVIIHKNKTAQLGRLFPNAKLL